jgi:hypothetical protein
MRSVLVAMFTKPAYLQFFLMRLLIFGRGVIPIFTNRAL